MPPHTQTDDMALGLKLCRVEVQPPPPPPLPPTPPHTNINDMVIIVDALIYEMMIDMRDTIIVNHHWNCVPGISPS